MIDYVALFVGILGLIVGVFGVSIGTLQHREVIAIKNRNRVYTWGLAKESHRLMAYLEQLYSALKEGKISLDTDDSETYKALLYRSYQKSTDLVSKVGEHLVVEYNVTEEELSERKDDKSAWGHLESSIRFALNSMKTRTKLHNKANSADAKNRAAD